MRVFISAGEASGDAYAAALVREMAKRVAPIPRNVVADRVKASNYFAPAGSTHVPASWEAKDALGLAEILAHDLEDALQDSRADRLLGCSWSDLPDRIYDLLTDEERRRMQLWIEGVGGSRLAAEIRRLVADSSAWGAVSIAQSLKVAPRALGGYERAKRALKRGTPGLFIPIDFGFFNIRLCKIAKRRGWKVLYFVPPGSWRRDKQGRDLPHLTDAVVTPFPWSAEILKEMGANAFFFGHPIKQLICERALEAVADRHTIAVLPGSRTHEIERNLPMIAAAAQPNWPLEFAIAPNLDLARVKLEWSRLAPDRRDTFTQGDTYGVLGRAQAAIVCSGTATLEAALLRCPHIVVYRVTKSMAREAKLIGFKRPKFIALPNIVLDRNIVPELLNIEIDPKDIHHALDPLLAPGDARHRQIQAFQEIDILLGPHDAISKTAVLALDMLQGG